MEGIRQPAVAGQLYPGDPERLLRLIRRCYQHSVGPRRLPLEFADPMRGLAGLIVPHGSYHESGPVAAHAYHLMARLGRLEVVVILGPNHWRQGGEIALSSWQTWETPLGALDVDAESARRLTSLLPSVAEDSESHQWEHSIEVQLPFLLHLFGDKVRILPIGLRGDTVHDCIALGQALVESLDGRPAAILASSDLSHNMPESRARDGDLRALQAIRDMDTEKLTGLVGPGGVNMCGPGAVVAMISAMSAAGATAVRVLAYGTTADTMGESSSVVGYAAAAARPMA